MKTVVAFSGGIDSTYNLWKLLTTTDDDIIAAYFDDAYQVINYGVGYAMNSTSIYQLQAARMLVDLLRAKYPDRPFEFVVNNIYEYAPDEVKSVRIIRHYAARVNSGEIDRIVFGNGWRPWDEAKVAANDTPNLLVIPQICVAADRAFSLVCTRGAVEFPYAENKTGTGNAILELPADILSRTVSCTSPKVDASTGRILNCGVCNKCQEATLITQQLAAGKTADETTIARDRSFVVKFRLKFLDTGGIWAHVTADEDIPAFYGAAL